MTDHTNCLEQLVIVLPSLDPDDKFDGVVQGLVDAGFAHVVIVDDGSDAAHQIHFDKAAQHPCCRVLHHGVNKGKGRALKTAFRCVLDELPEAAGVITIDGDGQHLLADIIACGERMLALGDAVVLGCRDFDAPGVPPRSVSGNKTTNRMFKLFFGITISDTQTGLRAIAREHLPLMCRIEGERYEYETQMLLSLRDEGVGIGEVIIDTVYIDENQTSHFNAFRDSWKIYRLIFRHMLRRKRRR